jgi:uncharacterized membrane protein
MASQRNIWLLLPRQIRCLPADLAAIVGLIISTNIVVFLPVISETPLRVIFGLPFVLFVPGYTLVAALFPEAGDPPSPNAESEEANSTRDQEGSIDGLERVALSFGLSIAITPLIGLVLNFTPWGIRLSPIMIAVSGVALVLTSVAASRRWALDPADRFRVPYKEWYDTAYGELFQPESSTDAILNVILVVSVLLAVGSVGYAVAVPKQGESFTEFYLLTENETGALVADDYPTEFTAGESQELVVGIGNHEHETVNYTVVVEIQRVEIINNETQIGNTTELRRFSPTVSDNSTWRQQHTVAPEMTGDRLRLQYLLYRGTPPTPLNRSASYRELHLWVNVTQ